MHLLSARTQPGSGGVDLGLLLSSSSHWVSVYEASFTSNLLRRGMARDGSGLWEMGEWGREREVERIRMWCVYGPASHDECIYYVLQTCNK